MAGPGHRWTTSVDLTTKVRRRWASGSLLSSYGRGEPFETLDLPIRGPAAREIGADLGRVQDWAAELTTGAVHRGRRRYTLVDKKIGGREVGRNTIPSRAVLRSYDEAWALLGVEAEVSAYAEILGLVSSDQGVGGWVLDHPIAALGLAEDWPKMIAALDWLRTARGSGRYLREISAPGVDTKFVERHRGVLGALLGVSGNADGFLTDLGLAVRPALVRMRFDAGFLCLPSPISEASFRVSEIADLSVGVQRALIVENEITYLSVPIPDQGVVIFGEGFRVNRAGALAWLRGVPVSYWGDLDTHGFAILDRLRAFLPHTDSVLMDAETLLAHRDRWGTEPTPTSARLERLTSDELEVYTDLVSDRYAECVRLEQERIDWDWVGKRFRADSSEAGS